MNLQQLFARVNEQLANSFSDTEIRSMFVLIIGKLKGLKSTDLHTKPDFPFSENDIKQIDSIVHRLLNNVPIQYILGETVFYDLTFRVNQHVLIPRPETEELVHWALTDTDKTKPLAVLDIGTGSGAIAVSLACRLPKAQVTATDISAEALKMTQYNARQNYATLTLVQHDVLSDNFPANRFDIIVSNPPYVRELEKSQMKPNVLQYEPHTALFVPDTDPLVFYRRIAQLAHQCLLRDGRVYVEINQYLGTETEALFAQYFSHVELRTDLNGNHRMLKAMGALRN